MAIPDSCFKIVLFTDETDLSKVSFDEVETIAVAMPNASGIRGDDWNKYATTIEHIESSTGYRFFMLLRK